MRLVYVLFALLASYGIYATVAADRLQKECEELALAQYQSRMSILSRIVETCNSGQCFNSVELLAQRMAGADEQDRTKKGCRQ